MSTLHSDELQTSMGDSADHKSTAANASREETQYMVGPGLENFS